MPDIKTTLSGTTKTNIDLVQCNFYERTNTWYVFSIRLAITNAMQR